MKFLVISYGTSIRIRRHRICVCVKCEKYSTKKRSWKWVEQIVWCSGALYTTITIYLGFIWHPNSHCWWSRGFYRKSQCKQRINVDDDKHQPSVANAHASYLHKNLSVLTTISFTIIDFVENYILFDVFSRFESCTPSKSIGGQFANEKKNFISEVKNPLQFFLIQFEWYWYIKFYCAITLMGNKADAVNATWKRSANRLKFRKKK